MSNVTISGQSQGGTELGYAEVTANGSSVSTTTGNDAWTGMTVTVTVGSRPIIVEAYTCNASNATAGSGAQMNIYESTTKLASAVVMCGTASRGTPAYARARLTPSAGSHTYFVKLNSVTSGNSTFVAAAASDANYSPAWIQVTEV